MSSSLYWRVPQPDGNEFGNGLKFALREYLNEGAMVGDWTPVGRELVPFLRGLMAGTTDTEIAREAAQLIALIEQHGSVELAERS